jgi:hypothetical protein
VPLADENTSVVDGLGKTELVDAGLETTLQEILNLEGQHVIELHAGLVKDTDADETANEGVTLEKALGVLLVESEKRTAHCQRFCAHDQVVGNAKEEQRTGQHDGSWRASIAHATPRACCGVHIRRRASAQYP